MDVFAKEKIGEVLRRLHAVTDKLTVNGEGGGDEGEGIDLLVSKIRALMSTNEEIWERCKPNQIAQVGRPAEKLRLYRVAYPKLTVTTSASGARNRSVVLRTASELEIRSFEPLPTVSEELTGFFHIKLTSESDGNPFRCDYEDCLTSILCTKDNIASQFLIILKAHLEQVQIALGEIEGWLLEVGDGIQFINQTFNSHLSQCELGSGNAKQNGICVKCFEPYENHQSKAHMAPHHPEYNLSWCSVPIGSTRQEGSYFVSSSHDLKIINLASPSDTYGLSFDLSVDHDRERLKRFLYLMEAP